MRFGKNIAVVTGAVVFLAAFWIYGTFPREDGSAAYVNSLLEKELLAEASALYEVRYQHGQYQLVAPLIPGDSPGSLEEQAACAILAAAQQEGISLPEDFQTHVKLDKLTTIATRLA